MVEYDCRVSIDGVPAHHAHNAADDQTDALSVQAQAFLKVDDPRPFFLALTPMVEYPPTGRFVTNLPQFSMIRTHDPAITGDASGR